MSMNPRKGTVTQNLRLCLGHVVAESDEHESSEGDCDVGSGVTGVGSGVTSDEHESSEGDCDCDWRRLRCDWRRLVR
mgnify:CR=1 FL=1